MEELLKEKALAVGAVRNYREVIAQDVAEGRTDNELHRARIASLREYEARVGQINARIKALK